jgi:hypothetical protein
MSLPTTPARDAALAKFNQIPYLVLVLEPDTCTQSFGTAPCLGTGVPCYNTFSTCKYKAAYTRGSRQDKFTLRGAQIPPGEPFKPYIISERAAPMVIDMEAGLSRRGFVEFVLADEPCPDLDCDPYYAQRATSAGATWWARWLARNPNYAGRKAHVMRGFFMQPWDWGTFITEQYIIEQIIQNSDGTVKVTLRDPLKLADRQKIPAPTAGRLVADIKAYEHFDYVVAATANSITFNTQASPLDGAYTSMEVYISQNTGAGQRRVITDYVGVTRTAIISTGLTDWLVVPDSTSVAEVSALQIALEAGKGALYPDPATSGNREFVQIGEECIEYTAKVDDVLSWDSAVRRASWGTKRTDHKVLDGVQLGRAWIDRTIDSVLHDILSESGILDTQIDLVQLADEINDYIGPAMRVDAYIGKPEESSGLLASLLRDIGYAGYWLPQDQMVHIVSMLPRLGAPPIWRDGEHIKSITVTPLHDLRITHSIARIGKINHAGSNTDATNFTTPVGEIDAGAMSVAEYGDARPNEFYSRWFGQAMWQEMLQIIQRRVQARRNVPRSVTGRLDHKDYGKAPGEEVWIDSDALVDASGANAIAKCVVTKITDSGMDLEVELRVMNWAERPAFFAPDTAGDYPLDSEYCCICQDDGLMPDGTEGYTFI